MDILAELLARPDDGLAAPRAAGRPGRGHGRAAWSDGATAERASRPACAPPSPTASGRPSRRLHDDPRDRDPARRAPGGPARPVPPARRRGDLPAPDPGHTSLDATPDELHRTGLAEIERIDARAGGPRRPDDRHPHPARRARRPPGRSRPALRDPRRGLRQGGLGARASHRGHPRLVRPTAAGAVRGRAHGRPRGGALDHRLLPPAGRSTARGPASTTSTPPHPETRPRYEAEVLAYHESIPGHHLQIAIAQELAGLPAFRRHLGPTAFFEGWGLYTERLADEMGLYSGDLDRIGVLCSTPGGRRAWWWTPACTRMGWTRQQAIDFMLEHTALAPNNIANEVDRYIVMPGPGPRLQDGPAGAPAAPRRGPRAAGAGLRHPRLPRRRPGQRRGRAADPARRSSRPG